MDTLTLSGECAVAPNVSVQAAWSPSEFDASRRLRHGRGDKGAGEPYYTADTFGIMRDPSGLPQVAEGSITPITRLDLDEDAPAVMAGCHIACGLAAAAWRQVGGGAEITDRDALICLIEDACAIPYDTLAETFCIAEHELQPARERVAARMATDLAFTKRFSEARATMTAGCVFFPWYRGDGRIPN